MKNNAVATVIARRSVSIGDATAKLGVRVLLGAGTNVSSCEWLIATSRSDRKARRSIDRGENGCPAMQASRFTRTRAN